MDSVSLPRGLHACAQSGHLLVGLNICILTAKHRLCVSDTIWWNSLLWGEGGDNVRGAVLDCFTVHLLPMTKEVCKCWLDVHLLS